MALDRKWDKFLGGPVRQGKGALRVTINWKGLIYMNTLAYRAFGKPEAVALYYNREEDAIAVEPASGRSPENFEVVKKQTGWAIHGSPFCRHYRISIPATQRFVRPEVDGDGVLKLSLRETVSVAVNRAK